jgi:hypothetical protein
MSNFISDISLQINLVDIVLLTPRYIQPAFGLHIYHPRRC